MALAGALGCVTKIVIFLSGRQSSAMNIRTYSVLRRNSISIVSMEIYFSLTNSTCTMQGKLDQMAE